MSRLIRMITSTIRFLLSPEKVLNWIFIILVVLVVIVLLFTM